MPGPKCSVCIHPDSEKIAVTLETRSTAKVAAMWKMSQSVIAKHKLKCLGGLKSKKPFVVPDMKPLHEGATPLEQAAYHCEKIEARLKAAEASGAVSQADIAKLYTAHTSALKHHSKLAGADGMTEAQMVRSQPWQTIRRVMLETLGKHPAALRDVAEAIAALAEGRRK